MEADSEGAPSEGSEIEVKTGERVRRLGVTVDGRLVKVTVQGGLRG